MGAERRMMVGRGPDYLPRVMEVDAYGYLTGVGTLVAHVPQFSGTVWYVQSDAPAGGDGNADAPLATIAEAIAAASAGDAIVVGAGTYTEIGLDLNKKGLELWPAMGVVISPASGSALTISGHYCKIWCPGGSLFLEPPANQTGLLVSGNRAYVSDVRTNCASSADLGFDLQGNGAVLDNCRCAAPLIAAFKIQGDKIKLQCCGTGGVVGDGSIGYWVTDSCDLAWLDECASRGHETAGYQVDTGCTHGTIVNCSSGGGDGRWVDADNAFVWSNFTFDDRVYHTTTFDNSGPTSDNLFRVYGSVIITEFSGGVETVLAADVGNGYIELWDGTNTIDVTDSPGPAFNSLPVLSFLHKIDDNTVQIAIEDSSQVRLYEDATKFGEDPNFQVTAKAATASFIRLVYSGAGASGAIHWHCQWRPLSEDGFVEAA